ncbi:gamma-glutamyltransferase [Roseomonas marmotae]|uniref:Gamma-glutamyltransferase n=1 Tax=Roseomonas marmotae TaxID=2768161 RepID=A0ABS3KFR3_9PROT|nr:gamma-glutamyltransferase [Roseomonas marmotae]MBO1076315.1 gamma-glutamyltransferase [Roseomonas marmotae]QTI80555.1 gamma-glutamyltransferase [Roseomonas marmotae]
MTSTRDQALAHPAPRRAQRRALAVLGMAATLAGCSTVSGVVGGGSTPAGQPGYVTGFLGGVVADEPRAALVGRDVLSAGGTAVDAAVAAGFALSVTLPSRAGLGGGGACLVFDRARNATEAVIFPAGNPGTSGGDRPAAVPMMARGLFALHTRKPRRPFEELVAPAEQLARFGALTSRALATDLAAVSGPLLADPAARAVFTGPGGQPLAEGDNLLQPDLSSTLAALRVSGVGDLYQGTQARRLEELSPRVGGPLTVEALRPAVAQVVPPLEITLVSDTLSFLPPPADGGLAAAVAARGIAAGQAPASAEAQGLAAAGTWRRGGGDPATLLANPPAGGGGWGVLPASTSLVVLDREGNAVSCAFSMNNLFGTGRIVPGMGFFLAAAPGVGRVEPPLLSAVMAHNRSLSAFRYAGASSGQTGAPLATALPAVRQLVNRVPAAQALAEAPEPGRGNAIACDRYLPGDPRQCVAATDPRGAGLAIGGLQ